MVVGPELNVKRLVELLSPKDQRLFDRLSGKGGADDQRDLRSGLGSAPGRYRLKVAQADARQVDSHIVRIIENDDSADRRCVIWAGSFVQNSVERITAAREGARHSDLLYLGQNEGRVLAIASRSQRLNGAIE